MKSFRTYILEDCKLNGLASGKTIQDLANKHKVKTSDILQQLKKGSKIEREHTKNSSMARKIAMDHVWEDPKYYDKLKKIENEEAPTNSVAFGNIAGVVPGEAIPAIGLGYGSAKVRDALNNMPKADYKEKLKKLWKRRGYK